MLVFFRLWARLWLVGILCLSFPVNAQTPSIQLPPVQLALIEGMSGPFANTGEAVLRNLVWALERVNARGGVATQEGKRRLVLNRYDSKGQSEEALTSLRSAIDSGAQFVLQGNSSANAAVLVDAIQKHNERDPQQRGWNQQKTTDEIIPHERSEGVGCHRTGSSG